MEGSRQCGVLSLQCSELGVWVWSSSVLQLWTLAALTLMFSFWLCDHHQHSASVYLSLPVCDIRHHRAAVLINERGHRCGLQDVWVLAVIPGLTVGLWRCHPVL